jgi:hypothetical protein
METEILISIMDRYRLIVRDCIDHRINEEDCEEYLLRFLSKNDIGPGQNLTHVVDKNIVDNQFTYNVWVKDDLPFYNYRIGSREFALRKDGYNMADEIYRYCRRCNIRFVFCFFRKINNNDFTVENIMEKMKMLRKIYRGCKILFNGSVCPSIDFYSLTSLMKKDDIFLTNLESLSISVENVFALKKKIDRLKFSTMELKILYPQIGKLNLQQFAEETTGYVTILDLDSHIRKISANAIVLSSHRRVGKDSSLNVLPAHLLRQVGLWL